MTECSSCKTQKNQLRAKRSSVIRSQPLYLCNNCFANGLEPRWLVIMAAKQKGLEAVRTVIASDRYVHGKEGPITLAEIL